MSKAYHFPVLLWKTHAGSYSGRLLDADSRATAVGTSPKSVLKQLKDFVEHYAKNDWLWEIEPDLSEPEFRFVKVSVVPEYRVRSRTFPGKDPLTLKLPCAVGRREGGMLAAVLPTVDVVFDFADPSSFENLVQHYVRHQLAGLSPRDLAPFLPPAEAWIETLTVRVQPPEDLHFGDDASTPLNTVADHLGDRGLRRVSKTWERGDEVDDLVSRLSDNTASICLVGPPGCGKTSVTIEAASRIERSMMEKGRRGARAPKLFWLTSAGRLVAGMRYLGQWEERIEDVIDELSHVEGVLCVENLLELVRLGGSAPESSIGAFLIPYLEHNELRIVTEATTQEIEACERLLPGLIDQLQIQKLAPFEEAQSLRILSNAGASIGSANGVTFTPDSTNATFQLFRRFLPYSGFPGRSISFLDELADTSARDSVPVIDAAAVRSHFSSSTGLPERFLDQSQSLDPSTTRGFFSSRILGQPEAVEQVNDALGRFKAGLNDPARPLGVFLFSGPTGVGKTALVRAVGDFLFPNKPAKDRLIRLDMSEYGGYDAARRLLGDPYGEPSELVRRIRTNPFGVLLLDEIEKASEEVFDIFLNVFEEGRLTDTFGRVTAFQSTLIIMTSNLGAGTSGSLGFSSAQTAESGSSAVKKFFRPEFFNRLDHIVPFRALTQDDILKITENELAAIPLREGMRHRKLSLLWSPEIVTHLASVGFDSKFGARPLQRKIEEQVTTPLARYLIRSSPPAGSKLRLGLDSSVVTVTVDGCP